MKERLYDGFQQLQEISAVCGNTSREYRMKSHDELVAVIAEYGALAENYNGLYTMAVQNYSGRYGEPAASPLEFSKEAIQNAVAWTEDTSLLNVLSVPPAKGLSGVLSKKAKPEEYQMFCQSAQLLTRYYLGQKQEVEKYFTAYYEALPTAVSGFLEESRAAVQNIAAGEDQWSSYPVRSAERTDAIYIGNIEGPLDVVEGLEAVESAGLTLRTGTDTWLCAPFAYEGKKPFALFVDYTGKQGDGEQVLANFLRSCIYQLLRGMAPYTYQIYYLDPARGASSLGEIQTKLRSAVDGNAYRLEEQLYHNRFRLLTVSDTAEAATATLKKLDEEIGVINRLRGGRSVSEYNESRLAESGSNAEDLDGVILQTFVIYENIHGRLNEQTVQILEKILDCSADCGITLIVTSVHDEFTPLDEFENRLLSRGMDHLELGQNRAGFSVKGLSQNEIQQRTRFFNLQPNVCPIQHDAFLELVSEHFHPNLDVEVRLELRVDMEAEWGQYQADDGIEIPVGVNDRNQVTTLRLGNAENAHGLLSGMTTCGKSSFIHTIINGVIMRYRPEDVQIWLSDYKMVEFRRYMTNTPPHIKYVGSAESVEYSLRFVDLLVKEYERRLRQLDVLPSLNEYRKQNGPDSMPRLLIIVDEFHILSNHCKEFPEYKTKLEHLLKASRAAGMIFLLSDQTCATGLEGLTEAGRQQLACRMSMRQTNMSEYNAVFNITNAQEVIPQQAVYEIVIRRSKKRKDAWGMEENISYYDHNKTIFTSPEMRDKIAQKSIETYGQCVDPQFIVEARREKPNWEALRNVALATDRSTQRPMYLGIPIEGGATLSFDLKPNYEENVMSIAENTTQASILVNLVESFRLTEAGEVYILASEYDAVYSNLSGWLSKQKDDPSFHVVTDDEDICATILNLCTEMEARRKKKTFERILVAWIGLTDITKNMSYYSEKRPESAVVKKESNPVIAGLQDQSNSLEQLMKLFETPNETPSEVEEVSEDDSELRVYNAAEDISTLMEEGPRRGIHNVVLYSSYSEVKRVRCVKMGCFIYRIANQISMDDAADFLGSSRANKTLEGKALDKEVAVFYNGKESKQFMPFLSDLDQAHEGGA